MKYKILLYFTIFIFSIELIYSQCAGTERWEVKVLTDDASDGVNFTPTTKFKTIESIRKLDYEKVADNDARKDIESLTVKIKCEIKKYKFVGGKDGDNDYHVVINPVGKPEITMVAEIPDPTCEISNIVSMLKSIRRQENS